MDNIRKKHIDEVQSEDIQEHFEEIINDNTLIDCKYTKVTPNDLPDWFDEKLFIKGQKFHDEYLLSMDLNYIAGILTVFLIPRFTEVVLSTNQSSNPCVAFKRYFQTILHIVNLHNNDFKDANSKFYKSINTIRWMHTIVQKRMVNKNIGITQRDMVLTQFGFIGYVLIEPEIFANSNDFEGRLGIHHFWRVIGYLLEIPDRLNVCRKNIYETEVLCEKIRDEYFGKKLQQFPTDSHDLILTTLEGLRLVDPTFHTDVMLMLLYKLHKQKYSKPLSIHSKLVYMFRTSIYYTMRSPYIGWIAKPFWNLHFKMLAWFVERYPIIAWMKCGKQHSNIKLYPNSKIF